MKHSDNGTGENLAVVDLGCGNLKRAGAIGVDHWAGPEVDVVADLNSSPWPFSDSQFDHVIARHVIEHIDDVVNFMAEIHRIGKHGATVEVTTPHFSSLNSWKDVTHQRHLSLGWYELLLDSGYLSAQTGVFSFVNSDVEFGSSFRSQCAKFLFKLMGARRWEKYRAFQWPARDFVTVLRIEKQPETGAE